LFLLIFLHFVNNTYYRGFVSCRFWTSPPGTWPKSLSDMLSRVLFKHGAQPLLIHTTLLTRSWKLFVRLLLFSRWYYCNWSSTQPHASIRMQTILILLMEAQTSKERWANVRIVVQFNALHFDRSLLFFSFSSRYERLDR
jgi:hypothetical protein